MQGGAFNQGRGVAGKSLVEKALDGGESSRPKGKQMGRRRGVRGLGRWGVYTVAVACSACFPAITANAEGLLQTRQLIHARPYDVASVGARSFLGDARERLSEVTEALRERRAEFRKWDKKANDCERALTAEQTWIHPLQGMQRMRQVAGSIAIADFGGALIPSEMWTTTLKALISNLASRAALASADAQKMFQFNREKAAAGGEDGSSSLMQQDVKWVNDNLLKSAIELVEEKDWKEAGSDQGVHVWKKYVSADREFAGIRAGKAAQFACVKATGVIDAPVQRVFELFQDNERAKEYNEYCKEIRVLAQLDPLTQVTYSDTGKPWSRDFVTRTYYHGLDESSGGTYIVSRGEEHADAPLKAGYTRMQMTIGANIMRPLPGDPSKTELTVLTHVNPGGLANTQFGAMVTNKLSAESPRQFLKKFNEVASGVKAPEKKSAIRRLLAPLTLKNLKLGERIKNNRHRIAGAGTAVVGAGLGLVMRVAHLRSRGGDDGGSVCPGGMDVGQPEFTLQRR